MKLTCWVALTRHYSKVYNVRARTRKEVKALLAKFHDEGDYTAPRKVTTSYRDSFELMYNCAVEGGMYWEGYPDDDLDMEGA